MALNILLKHLHPAQHLFSPIQITGVYFTLNKQFDCECTEWWGTMVWRSFSTTGTLKITNENQIHTTQDHIFGLWVTSGFRDNFVNVMTDLNSIKHAWRDLKMAVHWHPAWLGSASVEKNGDISMKTRGYGAKDALTYHRPIRMDT